MPLSAFHPAVREWFTSRLGEPSLPQREGWPLIRAGQHVLIAAPTGSGKTLAAFLSAVDTLFGAVSAAEAAGSTVGTTVLYVSPLRALANDVQKNLLGPIAEIRAIDPSLPEVRVLVRTGDTPAHERERMARVPPHVLVTTPESLHILLTSAAGLIVPPSRRRRAAPVVGRWSRLRRNCPVDDAASVAIVARQLLRRTGIVCRRTIERERMPVPWWRLVRELRTLEARGEVRGGRFVAGFDGEQYAVPEAIPLLRAVRARGGRPVAVRPGDPLDVLGSLIAAPHARTA